MIVQGGYWLFFLNRYRSIPLCAVLLLMVTAVTVAEDRQAQDPLSRKVTLSLKNATLQDALHSIGEAVNVKFNYSDSRLKLNELVTLDAADKNLDDVLHDLLGPKGIRYEAGKDKNSIMLSPAGKPPAPGTKKDTGSLPNNPERVQVTGTVTDAATQEPLPGVSVLVKGTINGIATDADGTYTIQAGDKDVLVFSFIGYKTVEVSVSARSVVDVALQSDEKTLATVVVNAGYYDVEDRMRTGSIATVHAEVIERQPVTNPLAALAGRMPGVFIQQTSGIPGGDFNIEIRGRNSLRNAANMAPGSVDGNEPLYIVDGVPFSTQKVSTRENTQSLALGMGMSPLTSINPADIENITILKDADATAIYGSRGANGVVLITTKKGKAGKTKFHLTAIMGAGKAPLIKTLNTQQYLALRREGFANDNLIPTNDPNDTGNNGRLYAPDLMIWDTTRYTNWSKYALGGTAMTTNIQGSLSGGSELTQFLFTVGYRKEGTVMVGDPNYQKGSGHLSVNHLSVDRKFTFTVSISGTLDKNEQYSASPGAMRLQPPNAPALYTGNGELNWENYTWNNPLARLNATYEGRTGSIIGNTVIGYELLPGLRVKSSFGLNSIGSDELTIFPSTVYSPALGRTSADTYVTAGKGKTLSWIIEPQLSWDKTIAKGKLSILIGSSFQEQRHERAATQHVGFASNAMVRNLSSASRILPGLYSTNSLYRYAAAFGRINYDWNSKYIINLTARRDGSSRFGPGKQFANFGAIGAAWIFTEESFIKNTFSWLSYGKLRGSYGLTGSDQIGDYQYLDTYSTGSLGNTLYQGISGLTLTKLYNPDFAWETNRKMEGAIELGFLNDRLLFNVSYYRNRSSDQLVEYTLPLTTGFSGILSNFPATVQNTGVEIELTTTNFQAKSFRWITSFNVTVPRNKLVKFPNIESSTYANTYIVGESIYIKQLFEYTGVDPQTGLYTFRDFDGDERITDEDRKKPVFIGYDFFGGMNNAFTLGNWKLDVFLQFVKQSGYNYKWNYTTPISTAERANPAAYLLEETRWQKPGDVATIQREFTSANRDAVNAMQRFTTLSDGTISDASFIRLKTLSLTYQLPDKWTKALTTSVFLQGQNLFVITRYKGIDPESQSAGLGPLRMLTAGIQLSF